MTAIATLTPQIVSEWVRLFPRQATETYTSSVTFMKQLTVVAISTITYLKNVFPEDSYTVESLGGIRLKVLKKKCKHELAQFVSSGLAQAFEAFDKKYLHQLVICFYDGDCQLENLVEYHIFEYKYTSDEVTMSLQSKKKDGTQHSSKYSFNNVRERTLHLIRAMVVILQASQTELPSTFDISLRLYYNEAAPDGYQAPGFYNCEDTQDHVESTVSDAVILGLVETPYHRLLARTYIRDNTSSSYEANPTQNPPDISRENDFETSSVQKSTSDIGERIQCPCNMFDHDDVVLLTCQYCHTQQHAACFGLTADTTRHCCPDCSDADPHREPTDVRIVQLAGKRRECLCVFRRTLEWCSRLSHIGAVELANQFHITDVNAAKLMKLLNTNGVFDDSSEYDLITPRKIIPERLQAVKAKFFQQVEHEMVEGLIAQTLSQSQPDPVADMLTPDEKEILQNATTLGKMVEPVPMKIVEEATLNKFQEVITNDTPARDEVLSGSHNPVDVAIGKRNKRKINSKKTGVRTKRSKPSAP